MKILIVLILILLIPISAFSTDWNYVGKLGDKGYQTKIQCLDSNNCFVINYFLDTLRVFPSADQGISWQLRHSSLGSANEIPPEVFNPEDVSIPDTNHIFISYYDRLVIKKSTDGGRTFKNIPIKDSICPAWNIIMYDSLFGFVTYGKDIYITQDGWETWYSKPNVIYSQLDFPYFINKDTVQFLSFLNDNKSLSNFNILNDEIVDIYYFMKNFSQDTSPKYGFIGFHRVNQEVMFFVGGKRNGIGNQRSDIIFRTIDNSFKWEKVHDMEMESKFGLQNISCLNKNNCMAVGAYGKVLMTKDGGDTWVYHPEGETPFKRGKESLYGPLVMQVAWAGKTPIVITLDSHTYRYEGDFFDFGTSVEDTQHQSTNIFPNPSSDKISVDLGEIGGVAVADLVIYDILGNEIMSIPNYTNKSEIDISSLSIGTYTIQIQTSTGSISQRFIKIKE